MTEGDDARAADGPADDAAEVDLIGGVEGSDAGGRADAACEGSVWHCSAWEAIAHLRGHSHVAPHHAARASQHSAAQRHVDWELTLLQHLCCHMRPPRYS